MKSHSLFAGLIVVWASPWLAAQSFGVLHDFSAGEGSNPFGLMQASDGTLFGATHTGGANHDGTLFSVAADGSSFGLFYDFSGNPDGASPNGRIQGTDGALYGTCFDGGPSGVGAVFSISTNGSAFTALHAFSFNSIDGAAPR
jgi:uncharacterized repeat protein (TIGR03803 family)